MRGIGRAFVNFKFWALREGRITWRISRGTGDVRRISVEREDGWDGWMIVRSWMLDFVAGWVSTSLEILFFLLFAEDARPARRDNSVAFAIPTTKEK